MKRLWMIVAGICIGVAAISLWWQHTDIAFVVATLGAVAWFLNYRMRIKESVGPVPDDEEIDESHEK